MDSCAALAAHHGASFADAAFTVKGRTRQYVAASPDGMNFPAQIPGTALWVETNQSAQSAAQVMHKLLSALGHAPGEFAVTFPDPPQRTASPITLAPSLHKPGQ